jgi:hypothetical protein
MKPRHAAALALVGWYLMWPPIKVGRAIPTAPFSTWTTVYTFDSAKDCEDVKLRLENPKVPLPSKYAALDDLPGFAYATCLASDDPRLKGN